MPQLGSYKVRVTFRDVTAYFSEEEWKILHECQKELYRSVMKEIHQALILLGHQIINSNALIRLYKGDGLFFRDHPDSHQTEMKAPNSSCYLDGQPDMLLEIIQEETCCRDSYGAKETKIGDNASKGYPAMNLNTLVSIKREENCPQYTEGRESTDSLGTVSVCIKEEGESVSMGHLHSEGRDVIHSPTVTDGSVVTSLFSPSINKDQGIHFKEEPKPEETDTVDGDLHRNGIDVQKDRKMPPCTASLGEVVVNVLQSTDIRTTSTSQMLAESNLEPREVNMANCESNIIIPTHGDFDQGPSKEEIHSYNECDVNIRSPKLCTGQPNIDQNGSRLTCPECEQSFSQRQSLTRHQRTHTNEKPYKCSECEEAYTNRKHLIQHQRQHMWDIVYKCNDCGQSFGQKGSLAKHQRTHSGVKLYSCTECEKSFCRREGLSKHKNIHMVDCAYKCSDCEKSFIWKESLIRHQRTHSGEKLFQCTECEKSFAYSHYLTIHKRKHTGERPYKCSECELSFSQKIVLIRHRRTHTGERPYQCTQCERSFSQKGNLAKHQITHSGEKPFNCSICDLNFSLKESLSRHQRNAH